ncbi:flagellar motor switch protein FliN [Stutzerimonas stutzeri A1501]|uniref:Flagellar motor switch protein FliN n=8 Tax=Stutzerimonas stutzeri TaxID=316 RepID=A4VMM8_STUS1|nr:flagellar motor switch protein FliN [Stutzerimonas stutzeri A1501]
MPTRATWHCRCWNPWFAHAEPALYSIRADRGLAMADERDTTSPEEQALADEWAAALAEAGDASQDDIDALLNQGPTAAAPAAPAAPRAPLEDFASAPKSNGMQLGLDGPNLDVILDIPVSISMEVGSTEISIRNLLQLNQGSVVELDRLAGEPLDVLVNGTLIAHGEVVVVNEKFGIRLTDVISPTERIKKLR